MAAAADQEGKIEENDKWAHSTTAVDILLHDLEGKQAEVGTLREAHDRSNDLVHKLLACLHAARRCAQAHLQALCPSGAGGEHSLAAVEEGLKQGSARQEFVCGIGVALQEASFRLADGRKSLGPDGRVQVRVASTYMQTSQLLDSSFVLAERAQNLLCTELLAADINRDGGQQYHMKSLSLSFTQV
jgi:hypothetical protein